MISCQKQFKSVKQHLENTERKSCQARILYPEKKTLKNEGKIFFSNIKEIKEFIISRPTLQEIIKEFFQAEAIIPDGNLSLYKEIKKNGNINCTGNYI